MSCPNYRNLGISALENILTIKNNSKIIEELVYKSCIKKYSENLEIKYKEAIYQVIGDILSKKYTLKDISMNIKKNKIGFDHHTYDDIRSNLKEQDDYLICPFEVEEGVMECMKCGNKRVITYSKQTRGGDEATSVFCTCSNPKCGNRWKL